MRGNADTAGGAAAEGTLPKRETWREALFNRRMLICVFTGFSSGLPLYLLINLLPAWLRTEGVDLKTIGFFALIQLPYTWKFLWSPLLDRYALPLLGRRRGWMLITQVVLLVSIPLFGTLHPKQDIWAIVALSTIVAFFSASQDIVLDAFRREILPDPELALGTSIHVNAYRVSSLVPGALALILADRMPWSTVYVVTALFMLPGIGLTLFAREPQLVKGRPRTLREAVVEPFHEFITRNGWRAALLVLLFIFLYKLGDSMATALATPFYLDMGFTMTDIGVIAKNAGLWASVIGGLLGRPVDGEDRHQSRTVALRRGPAGVDPRLRVARLRPSGRPPAARVRHCLRGARRGPRHGCVHRVHRAGHGSLAIRRRNMRSSPAWPRCRGRS